MSAWCACPLPGAAPWCFLEVCCEVMAAPLPGACLWLHPYLRSLCTLGHPSNVQLPANGTCRSFFQLCRRSFCPTVLPSKTGARQSACGHREDLGQVLQLSVVIVVTLVVLPRGGVLVVFDVGLGEWSQRWLRRRRYRESPSRGARRSRPQRPSSEDSRPCLVHTQAAWW